MIDEHLSDHDEDVDTELASSDVTDTQVTTSGVNINHGESTFLYLNSIWHIARVARNTQLQQL